MEVRKDVEATDRSLIGVQGCAVADKVLGAILTVEEGFEDEVRAYLDERETDAYGYELRPIELYRLDGSKIDEDVYSYVFTTARAPHWVGPLPLEEVARRIVSASSPLRGVAYVLGMAHHLGKLATSPDERDDYLDRLADVVYFEVL